jgi:hypothetical protein
MRASLLAAGVLAATTIPVVAADDADAYPSVRYARFTAKISGAQTTKWQSVGPSYTDCNGTRVTKGEGTEVFRFDSGKPEKVLVQLNPTGSVLWKFGTWSPLEFDNPLGLISDVQLTRHGRYTTTVSGGWCSGATSQVAPANGGDCGRRRGVASAVVGPSGGRLKVEVIGSTTVKGFDDCPVGSPIGVTDGGFTDTFGRLSAKLLFGKRKQIVVEDGKVYRRDDRGIGVKATSTTHFRLVLVRRGR